MNESSDSQRSELTHNDIPIAPDLIRNQFLRELLDDLDQGQPRSVEDYESRYPGYERLIAAEFQRVGQGADNNRTEVVNAGKSAARRLDLGDTVGRYVIQAPLAEGGMGIVYLATDELLGRDVVLKTALPQMARHADIVKRLKREAELAGRLDHSLLCPVLDVVIDDESGNLYIVQPFVAGETLESLHAKPTTPKQSLFLEFGGEASTLAPGTDEISQPSTEVRPQQGLSKGDEIKNWVLLIEDLCRALAHAHDNNVIHRDLKPNNIMIRPGGEPMILDFGLARDLGGDEHTEEGSTLGTPSYMAPEQVEGKIDEMGPRTDIYALGVILYKLLTGRTPYRGNTREALYHAILKGQPAAIRGLNAAVSKDLEAVCLKAMSRDVSARFASANDFADELRRIINQEPTLTRPLGSLGRLQRMIKRNPWNTGLALAAVLLAVLLVIVFDERKGAGKTARASQFLMAYLDATEAMVDEGRTSLTESEVEKLKELAGDNPKHHRLIKDPSDRKTYREIRNEISSGNRSVSGAEITVAWRPQGSIINRRPEFVFGDTGGDEKEEGMYFVRLSRGRDNILLESKALPLATSAKGAKPEGDGLKAMTMAAGEELVIGDYEWQIFRAVSAPAEGEEWEGDPVTPLLRFKIRSKEELKAAIPVMPEQSSSDFRAYMRAYSLHGAGFQIAALAEIRKVGKDCAPALQARVLQTEGAISLALSDKSAANRLFRDARNLAREQAEPGKNR